MEIAELHKPTGSDTDHTDLNISDDDIRIRRYSGTTSLKKLLWKRSTIFVAIIVLLLILLCVLLMFKPQNSVSPQPDPTPQEIRANKAKEILHYQAPDIPKDFFLECPTYIFDPIESDDCRWVFDNYESSEYESLWNSNIKEWQVGSCKRLAESDHLQNSQKIIDQVRSLTNIESNMTWIAVDSSPTGKLAEDYKLMSRFFYKRECYNSINKTWEKATGRGVELIEPLWGYLRNPFEGECPLLSNKVSAPKDSLDEGKGHVLPLGFAPYAYTIQDEEIHPNQWRTHGIPPWRNNSLPSPLLQSTPGKAIDQTIVKAIHPLQSAHRIAMDFGTIPDNMTEAIPPSLKWLRKTYHGHGVSFDKYIQMVEEFIDHEIVWEQLPDDLRFAHVFINSPIKMNSNYPLNILRLMKVYVKPDDFLVLKLNIEDEEIGDEFALSLMNDEKKDVTNLIDELYFEHKVKLDVMSGVWGKKSEQDLSDSYHLFLGLRQKGIRSHSSS
jgi:hypothetical protein